MSFPQKREKNKKRNFLVWFFVAAFFLVLGSAVVFFTIRNPFTFTSFHSSPPPDLEAAAAVPITLAEFRQLEALSTEDAAHSIASFLPGQEIPPEYSLRTYQLTVEVTTREGKTFPIVAEVFVPVSDAGENFPVIVYGAGTTGLDDRCAPSREDQSNPSLGNYRNQMIAQASQGYVVVLPNYEGFDTPELSHSYFNAVSEARSLLSAARGLFLATKDHDLPMQKREIFLGGYSQGGHAAFAAADYAPIYAPDIRIAGVYGHGPTTNTADLLLHNANLAPYFVSAYQELYPEFDGRKVLLEERWQMLGRARSLCVDEAFQYNTAQAENMYHPEFLAALRNNTAKQDFPEIAARLEENNSGVQYTDIPTLILQGRADPIVPPAAQQHFIDQLCQRGVPVSVQWYDGLNHFQTRQASFTDTNSWIDAVARGEEVERVCN